MVKKPRLFIALCTLPALILTIVFMIVPMVNAIYLSFTSSTALSVGFNSKFVFLDNYRYMFQDKDFLQALFNTLKLMLVIPAVTIFLSLVFAFILTQGQLKEKSFYRTVFFFPSIVSMTVPMPVCVPAAASEPAPRSATLWRSRTPGSAKRPRWPI